MKRFKIVLSVTMAVAFAIPWLMSGCNSTMPPPGFR